MPVGLSSSTNSRLSPQRQVKVRLSSIPLFAEFPPAPLPSRQRLPSSQKAPFRSKFSYENSSRHFAIAPLSQKAIAFREPYLHFVRALGAF